MSTYANGGWPFAVIFIGLCCWLGYAVYRKRYGRPRLRLAAQVAEADGEIPTATAPTQRPAEQGQAGEPERSSNSWSVRKVLNVLGGILALVLTVMLLRWAYHSFMDWSPAGTGSTHQVAARQTAGAAAPAEVDSQASAPAGKTDAELRQEQTLTLASDADKPRWIRVPDGYNFVVNAVGQTSIGMQCSRAIEEPPQDADGEQFWCNQTRPVGRWFRPYIYDPSVGVVTVHYHFEPRS